MSIRVIINGACGRMGHVLARTIEAAPDMETAALVDPGAPEAAADVYHSLTDYQGPADCVIDFSNHAGVGTLLSYCEDRQLPLILCTTGFTADELQMIRDASARIPLFRSANMSLGVALTARLVQEAAAKFLGSDIEILEIHHNRKADAPSGTALMLAEAAQKSRPDAEIITGRSGHHVREKNEIGVASLRMGNIVGTHEVCLSTDTETITIRHEAHDRALFADGAVSAARFMIGKPAGMYNMEDLLAE